MNKKRLQLSLTDYRVRYKLDNETQHAMIEKQHKDIFTQKKKATPSGSLAC